MDEDKEKEKKGQEVPERPIDPSRSGQDVIGDTSGLTGITTGNPKNVSAEPEDNPENLDLDQQPGGVISTKNPPPGSLGVPNESYTEKTYEKNTSREIGAEEAKSSNERASENENEAMESPSGVADAVTQQGAGTSSTNENVPSGGQFNEHQLSSDAPPSVTGEQAVSGDMPTPDSDDDTLANAQAVGTQTHEDSEHPEEVDIGRDVDEAEEYERTH